MEAAELKIELGSDPSGGCPCCDPDASFPQGYVTRAGKPYALYFADWEYGASGFVELLVSVGDFSEGSGPEDRRAGAFHGRLVDGKAEWTAFDARLSLWRDLALVGERLSAEQAASDRQFHDLAEAIGLADPRLQKALADASETPITRLRAGHSGGTLVATGQTGRN